MKSSSILVKAGVEARVVSGLSNDRLAREEAVLRAGFALPMAHRHNWLENRRQTGSLFFDLREGEICRGGFAVSASRSRVLPGHRLLRVERFGAGLASSVIETAVEALARYAAADHRLLRLHVETFDRDGARRDAVDATLSRFGFSRVDDPRRYSRTIAVDLQPDSEAILASLHSTARRHIRAIAKYPVELRPITDAVWAPRMNELVRETMDRTGGGERDHDWIRLIDFIVAHPGQSRLLGLFRTDIQGPRSMLAFAWACLNGNYAHYDTAASTRNTDLKLPLNYALAWQLMCWAREHGANWFDFGGITRGQHGDDADPLGGISDFKRYFSKTVIDVGGEWVLEPHPLRTRIAHAISRAAAWASAFKSRFQRPKTVVPNV